MKKFKRRILWLLVFIVVGTIVWGVVEHHRRKWRLEAYKAELVKQGVEFDLAKLIPPAPPEEENAAVILQQTIYALRAAPLKEINVVEAMKMMEPGRARVEWQQAQPDGKEKPVTWEQLAQAVTANESLLAQIRTAVRRPHLNFKLDYDRGFGLLLPHLSKMKSVSQWFEASALLKLRAGDASGAIGELECALLLAYLQREEPLLMSQLVAIAMDSIILEATWDILQSENLPDADLARLQAAWALPEQGEGMLKAVRFEMATTTKLMQDARASAKFRRDLFTSLAFDSTTIPSSAPQNFGEWVDHVFDLAKTTMRSAAEEIKLVHWKYFGSYNDEWINHQQSKEQIAVLAAIQSGTPANDLLPAYEKHYEKLYMWSRTHGSEFSENIFMVPMQAPDKIIQNGSYRRMAVTAIALKRYQLKHGEWPETLETLVPEYLAAVPLDPADGQPMRYARKEKGEFLLYMLGTNHRDDGGDPAREKKHDTPSFHAGNDWVWPMPVTATANP